MEPEDHEPRSTDYFNDTAFSEEHWARGVPPSERRRLDVTALATPDCALALEVGCGDGRLLAALRARGFAGKLVGVEPSRGVHRVAEPAVRAFGSRLPFSDLRFDAVLCCEVLEHLPDPLFGLTCAELARVAARHLVLTVPHREQLEVNQHRCRGCGERYHIFGHLRSFTPEALLAAFPSWVPSRLEVIGGESVRSFHRGLLRIKQDLLGLDAYSEDARCPGCGRSAPARASARPVRAAFSAINCALSPPRDRGGWILAVLHRSNTGRCADQ